MAVARGALGLLALGVVVGAACGGAPARDPDPDSDPNDPGFLLGGIQINEPDMHAWHDQLRASGFDTLAATAYARQGAWDSAEIAFDEDELGGGIVHEVRAAKQEGLHVVLVLRVALEHALEGNRFFWHGAIQPESDQQVGQWFERYGRFVLAWARVAEREGIDVLGIGSELSSLASTRPVDALPALEEYYLNEEKQARERARLAVGLAAAGRARGDGAPERALVGAQGETSDDLDHYLGERTAAQAAWARQVTGGGDVEWVNRRRALLDSHWRELIAAVRETYSGRLTFAANFDQYRAVGFWDALDVIGINAYFPLRAELHPGEEVETLYPVFVEAWQEIVTEIDGLRIARGLDQGVLFTELGYTARRGSTLEPWAGSGFGVVGGRVGPGEHPADARLVVWNEQPLEPMERALAVRALGEAARSVAPGMLRGLLWWKLSTQPQHREIESFVVVLGEEPEDPVLAELRKLGER
ncbi:MAG TPA: hypothetical protein VMV46_01580 [Thermoanaerobaculia bacterium]|nr:hypothetical protein [Thermoanaerobaculia bacterium]